MDFLKKKTEVWRKTHYNNETQEIDTVEHDIANNQMHVMTDIDDVAWIQIASLNTQMERSFIEQEIHGSNERSNLGFY